MPARLAPGPLRRALLPIVVLVATTACIPLPTESGTPTPIPTATPQPTPEPSLEPSETPEPTPEPYSLTEPEVTDPRQVAVTVAPNLPTDGSGRIVVSVTSLASTRIQELVVRWSTELDEHLFLAPFVPGNDRTCDGCPPLIQPWTKWVVGPGARGEPAGTTSLGYGPLLPAPARLDIQLIANRRISGPVSFDLQVLSGEQILTLEDGTQAWLRVSVP